MDKLEYYRFYTTLYHNILQRITYFVLIDLTHHPIPTF